MNSFPKTGKPIAVKNSNGMLMIGSAGLIQM